MEGITISLRRHAETSVSAVEAEAGVVRMLSEKGKRDALALGEELSIYAASKYDLVIAGYSSRDLRNQETLLYLMHGADRCRRIVSLWDYERNELSEPVIHPEFAKLKNVDEQGNPRGRTERFQWYLEHEDTTWGSTTPLASAEQASYFISEMARIYRGCGSKRVEAITSAPKQECFLHAFNPNAFVELLEGKTFAHLEALEVIPSGNVYVARFRDQEMQIPALRLEELAAEQKAMNDFLDKVM